MKVSKKAGMPGAADGDPDGGFTKRRVLGRAWPNEALGHSTASK